MKIRNGFVSNSSTSSFFLLGVKYDGADISSIAQKFSLDVVENDEGIVGFILASVRDDDYDSTEHDFSLDDLTEKVNKLKDVFGPKAKIKLFTGLEAC